jgi:transporter family-2 protein
LSHEATVILVVLVGFQLAVQAPLNSGLGRATGKLPAALISFLVGLSALLLICVIAGQLGQFSSIGDASLPSLFGGFSGAIFVATSTITISRIGAGAVAAATIAGQLTCSLILDDFGWVGVDTVPVTALRIIGAVLLLAGTALVVYRKNYIQDVEGAGKAGLIAVAAVVISGALVGVQHPLNAELADHIGGLNSALMNFITGTVLLTVIVVSSGLAGGMRRAGEVRWYYLCGGFIGVITVLSALTAVGTIGAAGLTAAIVTGQLLSSIALDRFGAFGLEKRKVTVVRVSGVALLIAGTFLTVS